jgi:alpha-L-fucosidase
MKAHATLPLAAEAVRLSRRNACASLYKAASIIRGVATLAVMAVGALHATPPPAPFGALPGARQLAWEEMEAYAFVHFTVNTFTDKEWGYGDESPAVFNPTAFDADQIVRAVKDAGLRGLVLTAKHHDGFCLWPSRYTEHRIAHSPYKNGRGDIVREISEARRRAGLKFGIYLSPWDRNRADYGQPSYLGYYCSQLRELLTNYGPIFEIWLDRANGGDGYYGGAREKRLIDRTTYYERPNTWKIVREIQPQAVIFSHGGPDARWVGNENGVAGDPCWATLNAADFLPGHADEKRLGSGDRSGAQWLPAEVDVSIRPGWFCHPAEGTQVKTPAQLFSIYLTSVGCGANLILNLVPDRRGQIADPGLAGIRGWRALLDASFARDLAAGARATAGNVRGNDARFAAANVLDGRPDSYWTTDDAVTTAEFTLDFDAPRTFNLVRLREYLPLSQRIQRIDAVVLDAWDAAAGRWTGFATATSIGAQRLIPTSDITTTRVRLRVTSAAACPALSELALFRRPAS